jgi:hypothetical protein
MSWLLIRLFARIIIGGGQIKMGSHYAFPFGYGFEEELYFGDNRVEEDGFSDAAGSATRGSSQISTRCRGGWACGDQRNGQQTMPPARTIWQSWTGHEGKLPSDW